MENSELERLYALYSEELFLYALSFAKNKPDAENLVSDAFFKLALQQKLPANVKFWLFTVVKNGFIDSRRKSRRWGGISLEHAFLGGQNKTEEAVLKNETYRQLYLAIEKLTAPYKEVIVFFYFCNWPVKEISEFLLLSPNQTRVVLHRGRKKLKEVLEDDC